MWHKLIWNKLRCRLICPPLRTLPLVLFLYCKFSFALVMFLAYYMHRTVFQANFNLTTLFISPSHCQSNLHDEYRIINSKIHFVWCKNRIASSHITSALRWCDAIWHDYAYICLREPCTRWHLSLWRISTA